MLQGAVKQKIRDYVYTFMYPEEYTLQLLKALLILAALVKEAPTAAQAVKKNSTTVKMKMNASESCIRKITLALKRFLQ